MSTWNGKHFPVVTILWYCTERNRAKSNSSMDKWQLIPKCIECPASRGCGNPRTSFPMMKRFAFITQQCLLLACSCLHGREERNEKNLERQDSSSCSWSLLVLLQRVSCTFRKALTPVLTLHAWRGCSKAMGSLLQPNPFQNCLPVTLSHS